LLPLELAEALEGGRPVEMEYLDARDQRTKRVIRPLHVKRFNGELTLVAHCELRGAQRTFKVERIVRMMRVEG
jgi:predicted DNA-binding transcriptional regulator YafY